MKTRSVSRRQFFAHAAAASALLLPRRQAVRPFTIALPSLPATLDPHTAAAPLEWLYARQSFDPLVEYGEEGQIVAALAQAWTLEERAVVFTLRPNVTFHNGAPLNADAVRVNLERVLAGRGEHAAVRALMSGISGAQALDERTVRIETDAPDPLLLNRLTNLLIAAPGAGDMQVAAFGTGAYAVGEYRPNRYLDLMAFEAGWRGVPDVSSARLLMVDDPQRMLGFLQRGEADVLAGIPVEFLAGVARLYTVAARTAGTCLVLELDSAAEPRLGDPRLREALSIGVDRGFLAQVIFSGFAAPAAQLAPPGYLGHDAALPPIEYNGDRARALLEQAGAAGLSVTLGGAEEPAVIDAMGAFLGALGIPTAPDDAPLLRLVTRDYAPLRFVPVDPDAIPLLHPQAAYPLAPGVSAEVAPDGTLRLRTAARHQR